jgi:hypothetical protein
MARIKGTPKTGGRKRGTKNKRTTERERALAETAVKITEALGASAFDGTASGFQWSGRFWGKAPKREKLGSRLPSA